MREILFRAKTLKKGEWVEGYIEPYDEGYCIFSGDGYWLHRVDPETICQYTGLTSKNGVKIWEGDIVSIHSYSYEEPENDYIGIIEYHGSCTSYVLNQPESDCLIPLIDCQGSFTTEIYVLGNRFDNSDLLTGGKDGFR